MNTTTLVGTCFGINEECNITVNYRRHGIISCVAGRVINISRIQWHYSFSSNNSYVKDTQDERNAKRLCNFEKQCYLIAHKEYRNLCNQKMWVDKWSRKKLTVAYTCVYFSK